MLPTKESGGKLVEDVPYWTVLPKIEGIPNQFYSKCRAESLAGMIMFCMANPEIIIETLNAPLRQYND